MSIRSSHLESGARRAERCGLRRTHAHRIAEATPLAPVFRQHGKIVDVQFVDDAPEASRTPRPAPAASFASKRCDTPWILQLGEVHLARPRIRERRVPRRRGAVRRCRSVDDDRRRFRSTIPTAAASEAEIDRARISTSGRRTYNGWTPAGSTVSPARARALGHSSDDRRERRWLEHDVLSRPRGRRTGPRRRRPAYRAPCRPPPIVPRIAAGSPTAGALDFDQTAGSQWRSRPLPRTTR